MTWVVATSDITPVESRIDRSSVIGFRKRPDGTELKWKQVGVLETIEDSQLPLFIQWMTDNHPSIDGKPNAEIKRIDISGDEKVIENWLGSDPGKAIKDLEVNGLDLKECDGKPGIISVTTARHPNSVGKTSLS